MTSNQDNPNRWAWTPTELEVDRFSVAMRRALAEDFRRLASWHPSQLAKDAGRVRIK